ncbi:MAG: TolC family protein, partial [Pseudomonadota bacterium]
GLDSENVPEELLIVTPEDLDLPKNFAPQLEREDIQAAKQQKQVVAANSQLGKEKTLPTLDIFANGSYNGLSKDDSKAMKAQNDTTDGGHGPAWAVGLSFTAPLDIFTTANVRQGYQTEILSAELGLQRKLFENERSWNDLSTALKDAQERFQVVRKVEELQQEKLNHEKNRLYKGKTVTYQVLQFEIDFVNAQLLRIREEARIISILSGLKMFRSDI